MSAAPMAEPVVRVTVEVTFLRMDKPPSEPPRPLPSDTTVVEVEGCSVPFYRYLYHTVGEPYLWWMRRAASDAELARILVHPAISIHVLYRGGEPAGFYELDRRFPQSVNLSYFGLMPHAVGTGLGGAFLRHAVDTAWREGPPAVTVNTCTADHPRALPAYLAAGFRRLRTVREVWPVPLRLGLAVPSHLRAG